MFVTNDAALYERVLTLSNHGRARGQVKQFWPDVVGFKYKMSNIQAAIGCAQLERIDVLIERKREIFRRYVEGLADLPGVTMNPEPAGTRNGYWMPTVIFAPGLGAIREALLTAFHAENIDGRVYFWPLSSLPMLTPCPKNILAYGLPCRGINLPSYHDMTPEDQARVISVIRSVVRTAHPSR